MCASGLKDTLHKSNIAEPFHHPVVGHGRLSYARVGRADGHPQTVFRVAGDVSLYASLVLVEVAPHQSHVAAVGRLVEELRSERRLRSRSLCHDEQSARVLVYPVDQSHLRIVGVERAHVLHVPCHGVDQRAVEVAHTRVHHQSGGLVDNHQLAVFVDDVERYVLRLYG